MVLPPPHPGKQAQPTASRRPAHDKGPATSMRSPPALSPNRRIAF